VDALASYDKALYLNPEHYEALIHSCLLYEERGDASNARAARERALRLQRSNEVK
jgi:Tfp pilus assembly protein PilF